MDIRRKTPSPTEKKIPAITVNFHQKNSYEKIFRKTFVSTFPLFAPILDLLIKNFNRQRRTMTSSYLKITHLDSFMPNLTLVLTKKSFSLILNFFCETDFNRTSRFTGAARPSSVGSSFSRLRTVSEIFLPASTESELATILSVSYLPFNSVMLVRLFTLFVNAK